MSTIVKSISDKNKIIRDTPPPDLNFIYKTVARPKFTKCWIILSSDTLRLRNTNRHVVFRIHSIDGCDKDIMTDECHNFFKVSTKIWLLNLRNQSTSKLENSGLVKYILSLYF